MVRKRKAEATASTPTGGIDDAVFRAVVDHSAIGIIMVDRAGMIALVNREAERLFGYAREELMGASLDLLIPHRYRRVHDRQREHFAQAPATRPMGVGRDLVGFRKDGTEVPLEIGLSPVEAGGQTYIIASVVDISVRRSAEQALVERDERFRQLADNIREVFFVMDIQFRETLYISPAYESVWGRTCESLYRDPSSFMEPVVPTDRERLVAYIARVHAGEDPGDFSFRLRRPDGEEVVVLSHAVPIRDASGAVYRLAGVFLDITQRTQAEAALHANETRLHLLFETVNLIVLELNTEARVTYVNTYFLEMAGYTRDEVVGKHWIGSFIPEATQEQMGRTFREMMDTEVHEHYRNAIVTRSGDERMISWHNIDVRNAAGERTGMLSIGEDITEHLKLERQFQQAQRMEAVGRLAGGIAHDFNNVLTIISGYGELLRGSFEPSDPRAEDVAAIQQAATSAATLTRQLLAFSRQQVLEPRILDLNEVVHNAEKMLRRTIGEDIDLKVSLAASPTMVRADPGQVEQVLMNLAVNARDAMPNAGHLTIETSVVEMDDRYIIGRPVEAVGPFICLAISDTGTGMDEATKARIFDPFFTTKEVGKGTGLGLSTVYGIVQQSSGFIWVYSELGHGTTFKIYLPRTQGEAGTSTADVAPEHRPGTETILVVEDAAGVRVIVHQALERMGYRVLEAPDGATAIAIVSRHAGVIDLLVSDVVMPGMNGRELAEQLVGLRPDLRVLFVSGYTDDAVMRAGLLEGKVHFLQKPFTPEKLLNAVRSVLDG